MKLKGKVAVVLGASAQAGTGWAIAERFAAEGAKVIVAARREAHLRRLADKIGGVAQACDVGNEDAVAALAQSAIDRFGQLDIAVNAAGLPLGGTIANTPHADIVRSIELNFYGSVFFVKHMARVMSRAGSITLFSSMAATHPLEHVFAYACAKAAVDCLVRYAAIEHGARGIRVNSILPGAIRSEMSAPLWSVEGMEQSWAGESPLGRIGTPADFADAALWLAGDAFVTGLNLPVSGGNQLTRFPRTDERPALAGVDPTSGA
ncbi:SDR family oxidoreductase [Trinickia violacea]|uniref:SDR family oxidoreductase n=1 Tax=Trinickia violacea TaxID=2571746 RepID=A0A4P8ITK9_9BURK|nr:SDR family oxidoreductase [Trinickia violacea]QCP50394.1 SDR family oxidoreductase [Trinickia violacea]